MSAGESAVALSVVRLADGRFGAALPPGVGWLADGAPVAVDVGDDHARAATATTVRSGRAWAEVRGRLRGELGPLRRLVHRPPAEVLLLELG